MTYTKRYMSPIGEILLAADDAGLTGLWFEGSKYFAAELPKAHIEQDTPVLLETTQWLDVYFCRKRTGFHAAATPHRLGFSAGGLEHPALYPLRPDDNLRPDCKAACKKHRDRQNVRTGGWRCGRAQSDLDHRPLPPRCGYERQPDRLRRRP